MASRTVGVLIGFRGVRGSKAIPGTKAGMV
jgi:hypothetical protein